MAAFSITCRDAGTGMPSWSPDMDGPVPDHTTIRRAYGAPDKEWPEGAPARAAGGCLEESGIDVGAMAADSSGTGTDRYADATVPGKKTLREEKVRVKPYLKWHVLAVIGLRVILSCRTTPGNVNDTGVLPCLLDKACKLGRSFDGWVFNAGRGYDPDSNCRAVIGMGMHPDIKQRRSAGNSGNRRNVGRPSRRMAGKMSGPDGYKRRGMAEGIFGAGEAAGHRLRRRYRRARAGKVRHRACDRAGRLRAQPHPVHRRERPDAHHGVGAAAQHPVHGIPEGAENHPPGGFMQQPPPPMATTY